MHVDDAEFRQVDDGLRDDLPIADHHHDVGRQSLEQFDRLWPAHPFRLVHRQDRAEFFIAFTKDDCDRLFPGIPVYRVERMGALLSMVLDRRDITAEQRMVKRPVAGAVTNPRPVSAYP